MPQVERTIDLHCPIGRVWEFLCRPSNLVVVSPPELNLSLIEAPDILSLGSRIVVQVRRWGVTQRLVSEVTALVPESLLVDEQREGPFGKFVHTRRLEPIAERTRSVDRVEFEPPRGLLGLVLSATSIQNELEKAFDYRTKKFREILETQRSTQTACL
jgi:ligand-binding SRPBCC domain-containing protein